MPAPEPNALTKLKEFQAIERMPEQVQVYLLPWILHLVEDIHNPLHALWDAGLGTASSDRFLSEVATTIEQQNPMPAILDTNPEHWASDGFALRGQLYSFSGAGTERDPAVLTDEYAAQVRKIASHRAALAGYRLADFFECAF